MTRLTDALASPDGIQHLCWWMGVLTVLIAIWEGRCYRVGWALSFIACFAVVAQLSNQLPSDLKIRSGYTMAVAVAALWCLTGTAFAWKKTRFVEGWWMLLCGIGLGIILTEVELVRDSIRVDVLGAEWFAMVAAVLATLTGLTILAYKHWSEEVFRISCNITRWILGLWHKSRPVVTGMGRKIRMR